MQEQCLADQPIWNGAELKGDFLISDHEAAELGVAAFCNVMGCDSWVSVTQGDPEASGPVYVLTSEGSRHQDLSGCKKQE